VFGFSDLRLDLSIVSARVRKYGENRKCRVLLRRPRTTGIIRMLDLRIRNSVHLRWRAEKFAVLLAVSKTSASASTENNRQREQDHCDRYERRAGDVSEQDEDDRDDREDCCDVEVHSFQSWVCRRYRVSLSGSKVFDV